MGSELAAFGGTYWGEIEREEVYESPPKTSAPDDPFAKQLLILLKQGKTLEAVSLYQRQRGSSLSEAKAAIDDIKKWL